MSLQLIDHETGEIIDDPQDEPFQHHANLVYNLNEIKRTFMEVARDLHWIVENKAWKALGEDSLYAYYARPDVDLHPRTAERLIKVYKTYVLDLKVEPQALLPAGYRKLEIASAYATLDNVDELIAVASENSFKSLEKYLVGEFPPEPNPPLPEGLYSVIYADPAWGDYKNSGFAQYPGKHYQSVMTTEEICAMPISDMAAPDAALFLWVPSPLLPSGLAVMEAWGFEYKGNFIWKKNRFPGIAFWMRTRHEHLLVGSRGKMLPNQDTLLDSVFEESVTVHSAKPHIVYSFIEAMFPDGKYLELFARNDRRGWTSHGNEIQHEEGDYAEQEL